MTLTEFLLARIADDVKWARGRRDEDFRKHRVSGRRPHLAPDDAERVLTQCAAYRAIVEAMRPIAEDPTEHDGWVALAEDTLRALASIYASHPDYREEWKP